MYSFVVMPNSSEPSEITAQVELRLHANQKGEVAVQFRYTNRINDWHNFVTLGVTGNLYDSHLSFLTQLPKS